MQTSEVAAAFLTAKAARGLSRKTLISYRSLLNAFAKVCPELPMEPTPIEDFLAHTGPSLETRETYFRVLRNLYRWLHKRQLIPSNPMNVVERPRLLPRLPRALSAEELHLLLTHPSHSDKMRAFLYLLANTGLRIGEALSVGPHTFSDNGFVRVKGKTGEREVPISPEVKELVIGAWPWPWSDGNVASHAVRRAFSRAGIGGRRASAHTIRHTFARMWGGSETTLVHIMGWTSPRMLARYRPADRERATREHSSHNPLRQLGQARQLSLL